MSAMVGSGLGVPIVTCAENNHTAVLAIILVSYLMILLGKTVVITPNHYCEAFRIAKAMLPRSRRLLHRSGAC